MSWGVVEAEAEVTEWLLSLPAKTFGHVRFYIDLLADQGVALDEPFTRQLLVLLTVFRKTRQWERGEIDRAWQAMRVCMTDHLEEAQ